MDCIMILNLARQLISGSLKDCLTVNAVSKHIAVCGPCRGTITILYVQNRILKPDKLEEIERLLTGSYKDGHYSALGLALMLNGFFFPISTSNLITHSHLEMCTCGCSAMLMAIIRQAQIHEREFIRDPRHCLLRVAGLE